MFAEFPFPPFPMEPCNRSNPIICSPSSDPHHLICHRFTATRHPSTRCLSAAYPPSIPCRPPSCPRPSPAHMSHMHPSSVPPRIPRPFPLIPLPVRCPAAHPQPIPRTRPRRARVRRPPPSPTNVNPPTLSPASPLFSIPRPCSPFPIPRTYVGLSRSSLLYYFGVPLCQPMGMCGLSLKRLLRSVAAREQAPHVAHASKL